jgi:5-oxoprolinase (ATP-hydrolysing)
MNNKRKCQFWIDRGGTFTDVVMRTPDGGLKTHKLLSENREQYADAALQGIRDLLGISTGAAIPAADIESIKMGTTVATNALLERKGDRTILIITEGFGDALRIGYQNRPRLFDRHIVLPEMLYEQVIEVAERVTANGEVLQEPNRDTVTRDLQAAYDKDIHSAAIVFMHGYRFPAHEQAVASIAREIGFTQVSVSHEVSPLVKLVSRGDTTVVDAYLSPILRRYVDGIANEITGNSADATRLMFMQSNGGLTDAHLFQGKDSILSGPAGGVVGMVRTAVMAGFRKVIGFDMGGTSTDVSHYDGEYEREFETLVAGVRMRAPMMRIHTVAAGGGSILYFDGARYRVGPDSAGADPGPACYRRGGPLAVTDCNVMLGKIQPKYFPCVFGPNADEMLDAEVVHDKFKALADDISKASGQFTTAQEVAEGFLKVAVENMANAIKQISVQRGYDVTEYTLNCFGGAAGQHACLVADSLGMKRVFLHPFAGVLSAYGMGLADIRTMREQTVEIPLTAEALETLNKTLDVLDAAARSEVADQGVPAANIDVVRKIHLRYEGTDTLLIVNFATLDEMIAEFEDSHMSRFGFSVPDRAHIVGTVSAEAIGLMERAEDNAIALASDTSALETLDTVSLYSGGETHQAPIYDRDALKSGQQINGPAIIIESTATTLVEPGWLATTTSMGHLVMKRVIPLPTRIAIGTDHGVTGDRGADPILLEIFNNLFMSQHQGTP